MFKRISFLISVAAIACFVVAAPASAVTLTPTDAPLAGSNFQGGDGDQADPGADVSNPADDVSDVDWQSLAGSASSNLDDNVFDTAFAGGAKESDPGDWSFITEAGGVSPNKDNLLGAWSESAANVSGEPNTYVYLAFTREAQTGNTFITFELNQLAQTWNNGLADITCRTTGDLLVSYEVASGGSPPNVDVIVYRWIADTSDDATGCSKTGHFQAIDPQPNAEGAVNKDAITNYLSSDALGSTFAAGTFGEAALNLTGILQSAELGVCENFGQVSMHTRSSTSIDSQLQDYVSPVPVLVQSCGIHVQKTGAAVAHEGDPETFDYAVTNTGSQPVSLDKATGVVDDKCAGVVYDSGDTNDYGLLDAHETWLFHCDYTVSSADENDDSQIVNTVTASGAVGDVPVSDSDTWTTLVIHPAIDVAKSVAETSAFAGDTLHYTVTITNTGDTGLTVTPADAGCDGFDATAFDLAAGDAAQLSCVKVVPSGVTAVDNTASAVGVDALGESVSDQASVSTPVRERPVFHPAIAIDKTGPASGQAGDKIGYVLTVTNPGDEPVAESGLVVSDLQCNGDPVTLIGKGGDTTPDSLDPGDVWTYSCSVQTNLGDIGIHNVATVTAPDASGTSVSANDDANTTLTQPGQLVLPERITPGKAQLLAPTGCQAKAFNARVKGTNIATVVFVLDGNVVKRVHAPDSKGFFALRVNPQRMRIGVHRLVVNVTFKAKSGTKPKTLRVSFQRCGRRLIKPRFTG